jgi:threonine dehydrogenase-like Zn-dependent dehydrogenase
MRQLTFVEKGRLEWREVEAPPPPAPGQATVRPVAVATCDLDAQIVRGRAWWFHGAFPFGHECVAEVVEVGDGVGGERAPGALVSVPFQVSCGTCDPCRRGEDAQCDAVPRLSFYGMGDGGRRYGGFLSDAVLVPFADHMLVPVPDGIPPERVASLSDNIPDAYRTVGPPLAKRPGAPVLVCGGAGSIDLYAISLALALGAERVDYASRHQGLRERAADLGASVVAGDFPDRVGAYPITVDASADHAGLACALRSTAPEGTCTSIGIYAEERTPVPLFEMYTKGITFKTGMVHARPAMEPVLDLVREGRFAPERVTTRVVGWEEAPEALVDHFGKLVLVREEAG